jgi:hypothetical protein
VLTTSPTAVKSYNARWPTFPTNASPTSRPIPSQRTARRLSHSQPRSATRARARALLPARCSVSCPALGLAGRAPSPHHRSACRSRRRGTEPPRRIDRSGGARSPLPPDLHRRLER